MGGLCLFGVFLEGQSNFRETLKNDVWLFLCVGCMGKVSVWSLSFFRFSTLKFARHVGNYKIIIWPFMNSDSFMRGQV